MRDIKLDENLSAEQRHAVTKLIFENLDIFSEGPADLGRTLVLTHDIVTEAPPI